MGLKTKSTRTSRRSNHLQSQALLNLTKIGQGIPRPKQGYKQPGFSAFPPKLVKGLLGPKEENTLQSFTKIPKMAKRFLGPKYVWMPPYFFTNIFWN